MRILHVLAARSPGGAEVLTRDLAIQLDHDGHSVGIAFISRNEDIGTSLAFQADFERRLADHSVRIFDIGHAAKRNPLFGAWRLSKILREYDPQVLHVHLQSGLLFRLLLAGRGKFVTVYTHHTDHLKFGTSIFRMLATRVDGFVAISQQAKRLLERHSRRPVALIPNAVAFPQPSQAVPRSTRVFRVLSVGRLYLPKDYPTLVRTAAMLFRSRPDLTGRLRFEVVGDGPERPRIEALIAQHGLEGKVCLLGARSDARDLMLGADALLMTSSWEGLPISLIEALHAGLPIVATNVGSCAEVVHHGNNGFLAPAGDAAALADHLLRLFDDDALRAEFSGVSRKLALRYSIETSAHDHAAFYATLLAGKTPSRQRLEN